MKKENKLWSGPIATGKIAFERLVKKFAGGGLSIAVEAGNQTAWVHEELVKLGAEVTVVNPTKVKLIAENGEVGVLLPMHQGLHGLGQLFGIAFR